MDDINNFIKFEIRGIETTSRMRGNFCKKVLKYELDFTEVVNLIVEFIQPIFDLIVKENEFFKKWSSKNKKYV